VAASATKDDAENPAPEPVKSTGVAGATKDSGEKPAPKPKPTGATGATEEQGDKPVPKPIPTKPAGATAATAANPNAPTHQPRNPDEVRQPVVQLGSSKGKGKEREKSDTEMNTAALKSKEVRAATKILEARVKPWDIKTDQEAADLAAELGLPYDDVQMCLAHASQWTKRREYNEFSAKVWAKMQELNSGEHFLHAFVQSFVYMFLQIERTGTRSNCPTRSSSSKMMTRSGRPRSSSSSRTTTSPTRTRRRRGHAWITQPLPRMPPRSHRELTRS
jgi:hypothetical protein